MSERVIDANGREIKVGSRIAPYFHDGEMTCPGGVVTQVTEAEGDVDDYGRSIQVGPRVFVTYDDGIEDDYLARWEYNTDNYICEDADVEEQ